MSIRLLDSAPVRVLPEQPPQAAATSLRLADDEPDPFAARVGAMLRVRPTSSDPWSEWRGVVDWKDSPEEPKCAAVDRHFDVPPQQGWQYQLTAQELEVDIIVSANRDHLTREEAVCEPAPLSVAAPFAPGRRILARDLPDFYMDYALFARASAGGGADSPLPSREEIYVSSGAVHMPWSRQFQPPPHLAHDMPWVSLPSGMKCRCDVAVIRGDELPPQTETELRQLPSIQRFDDRWPARVTRIDVRPLSNGDDAASLTVKSGAAETIAPPREWTTAWSGAAGEFPPLPLTLLPSGTLQSVFVRMMAGADPILVTESDLAVPLEHVPPAGGPDQRGDFWRLRFRIAADPRQTMLVGPPHIVLQGVRHGTPTQPAPARLQADT
jgi:hypothetical protein